MPLATQSTRITAGLVNLRVASIGFIAIIVLTCLTAYIGYAGAVKEQVVVENDDLEAGKMLNNKAKDQKITSEYRDMVRKWMVAIAVVATLSAVLLGVSNHVLGVENKGEKTL